MFSQVSKRPAQKFAPRCRQQIAAERRHVDRDLADRPAGVEQIGNSVAPRDATDLGGRVDQPAVGRDPGDRDQLDAAVDHGFQRHRIEHALGVVGDHLDDRAGALGGLDVGDVVGGVFGARGQDTVARRELEGVESQVPAHGGVLHQRDLVSVRPDQARDRAVNRLDPRRLPRLGLVTADRGLLVDVVLDRRDHRRGHQRRAGVVQVDAVGHPRRLRPQPVEIECHGGVCSRRFGEISD